MTNTTAAEMLRRLNALRAAVGQVALKHPLPKAKMQDQIARLTPPPVEDNQTDEDNQIDEKSSEALITLKELCAELGIKPRTARARLRAYLQDGEYTRYVFSQSELGAFRKIILGELKAAN